MNLDDLNKRPPLDVYAKFEARPGKDEEASKAAGYAVYKDEHWVILHPKGEANASTEYKVPQLPKSRPHIWEQIRVAYEAWCAGQDEPVDGVPLKGWSGCTESQRMTLANIHVRSVEDLSKVTDAQCEKQAGLVKLRDIARNWLTSVGDGSRLAEQNAALQDELREKGEMLTAQQKELDELKIQMKALMTRNAA
jgi:hypothetical protein